MYLGQGRFTSDSIPDNFFGVAGVAEIRNLQDVLLHIGNNGHRHHVSLTPGDVLAPLQVALGHYLGFEVSVPRWLNFKKILNTKNTKYTTLKKNKNSYLGVLSVRLPQALRGRV